MGQTESSDLNKALATFDVTDAASLGVWLHKLRGGLVATHGYLQLALANKYGTLTPELQSVLQKAKAGLDEQVHIISLGQQAARDATERK